MERGAIALVLLAIGTASAFAGPIEDRKALMKQNADAAKIGTGLAKGDILYDQAKAEDVLKVHEMVAAKLPTLVPDDSKTGDKTSASPKIWEDMAGFKAAAQKFGQDASAAMAQTKDQASFAAAYKVVVSNCGACHQAYRTKQN
jgi:cytochrome c556